ncbi:MAG TPA: response regulator [Polyangiaceae bacterium]|nr:response regulator [Polyangiaceae bacterium]
MGHRLLVVDDDATLVEALRCLLLVRFPDALVETCTSAAESLQRIEAVDYDLILSDVRMPGVDGITLLRQAHELRPNTPIVLLTGLEHYDVAIQALRGGAFDFLAKPVDNDNLVAAVVRGLRARELGQRLDAQRRALAERATELAGVVEAKTRELREANRLKDEFLATLSHELRTPLTAILGWSRLLLAADVEPHVARQAMDAIQRNATHQARLVDDLLDIARIMTGKLMLDLSPVRLEAVVHSAVDSMTPTARARNIEIRRQFEPDLVVNGDADRLQQVAMNLLSNAIKFTPEGGTITVELSAAGDRAKLTVTDTGVGIEPSFLPKVFDRFRQADGSLARSKGGLGVGLAIARHLVELHDGEVHADSAGIGHGAAFTVTLPTIAQFRATRLESGPTFELPGVRVLLVEDDPDARALLKYTLERGGAHVTDVDSAARAFAELDCARYDVLLCDVSMPTEDGYSFMRRVRARGPEGGGDIHAAAVTAHARPEDVQMAIGAGFDTHLAKPIEPDELVATVARLLEAPPHSARRSSTV